MFGIFKMIFLNEEKSVFLQREINQQWYNN